ncbi:DUF1569 domain-containing protein [Pedobacter aquatilis]|uniref:DUF1569 domain-containing protein n=1 Tax=Pedobacter aquatilis TaxID=351343 RepID=UPI00293048DB|nr:DUF1569 domain-containing protein [Pedobacter aquatilis]
MKNIFQSTVTDEIIGRINNLKPETPQLWGKMNVAQMLAHCNVSYELVYDNIHPKPNAFMKFIMKALVKNLVVNEKPYKKSSQTAPAFIIVDEREFEKEKVRLIEYINKTKGLGEAHFDGKESHSFGKLNKIEWNNMFYKHLDHHLNQFGV